MVDVSVITVSGPRGQAGPGVPAGGAAGQVLAKASGADYATGWTDQAAASQSIPVLAGEALGGHRAVHVAADGSARYASASLPATAAAVIGITAGAAALGASVSVQTGGRIVEPSWNWTPGPVYLGESGLLSQTPPASGTVKEIGVALAATELLIDIKPEIIRG